MRIILFFLSFFFLCSSSAQIETWLNQTSLPIRYFPFYNGIQMIEVDFFAQSLSRGAWENIVHPRGGSSYHDALHMNISNGYILRNEIGEIIQSYGVPSLKDIPLLPPNEAPTISHKTNFERLKTNHMGWHKDNYRNFDEMGYAYRIHNEKMSLLDTLGNLVLTNCDQIIYRDSLYVVVRGAKFGLFDSKFKERIPPQFDYLEIMSNNVVLALNKKYYFLDANGKALDNIPYDNIANNRGYDNGFIFYQQENKWGLMNLFNQRICEPKYGFIKSIYPSFVVQAGKRLGGYYAADSTGKCAVINSNGREITPFIYNFQNEPKWREDGYLEIECLQNVSYGNPGERVKGVIDSIGKIIAEAKYEYVGKFQDGLAVAKRNGRYLLLEDQGLELTEPIYTSMNMYQIHPDYIIVMKDKLYGLLDKKGNQILPPRYNWISCIKNDEAAVQCETGKMSLIHLKTGVETKYDFDFIGCFVDGYATVRSKKKWALSTEKAKSS